MSAPADIDAADASAAPADFTWDRPAGRARLLFHLQALVQLVFVWLPLSAVTGGFVATMADWGTGAAWTATAAFVGFLHALWYPSLSFDRWAWSLRDAELVVSSGVIFRSVVGIPLGRIQHVDLRQGPLELSLGLARLQIHTASGLGADGTIPGMELAAAEALRERLVRSADGDDGV